MKETILNNIVKCLLPISSLSLLACSGQVKMAGSEFTDDEYFAHVMLAPAIVPSNLVATDTLCSGPSGEHSNAEYKTAAQVNYQQKGWPKRIAADWQYFDIPAKNGKLLIIDYQQQDGQLGYRYLANGTQNELYEPWSSTKIQAFSAAVAKVRSQYSQLGGHAYAGDTALADLITSINSYGVFGNADGNSNAIASYLVNVAGREYLSSLFGESWLNLDDKRVLFNGAYGSEIFQPSDEFWHDINTPVNDRKIPYYTDSSDDPGYLAYQCEHCGLTGNKAMTTLAQAEWLKRLASHQREQSTQLPHLQFSDIDVLFNGTGHTDKKHQVGGMMMGISHIVTNALANALAPNDRRPAKQVLDQLTDGQWRVWQKIGWGPSETRTTTETVMLAHVCLPNVQGGREFTFSAQNSTVGADEEKLAIVGRQMELNLRYAFQKILSTHSAD
ncbi:hypothetical protein [Pseudoalteromonas mariniglutinosa]|uniref:hypothetical protein n=1 Tax=Pseudoalteromonas mariniglutinosa TaxID=206042 RepID=UPI00384E03AC